MEHDDEQIDEQITAVGLSIVWAELDDDKIDAVIGKDIAEFAAIFMARRVNDWIDGDESVGPQLYMRKGNMVGMLLLPPLQSEILKPIISLIIKNSNADWAVVTGSIVMTKHLPDKDEKIEAIMSVASDGYLGSVCVQPIECESERRPKGDILDLPSDAVATLVFQTMEPVWKQEQGDTINAQREEHVVRVAEPGTGAFFIRPDSMHEQ